MSKFTPAPIKPVVRIATLTALEIGVGTTAHVQEIPRSERLMTLTVNFGDLALWSWAMGTDSQNATNGWLASLRGRSVG